MARRSQVRIRLRYPALANYTKEQMRAATLQAAQITRERARDNLRKAGRFDTGELDRTITIKDATDNPTYPRFAVGSPVKQAVFNEFGTRAHGPVRAKVLRFKPKGSSAYVFAKWVRGISAVRFMRNALKSLTVYDFTGKR